MKIKKVILATASLAMLYLAFFVYDNNNPQLENFVSSTIKNQQVKETSDSKFGNVSSSEYFLVTKIIDGDTIEIETGQKVRYIGINTPEIHHPTKKLECFGKEAAKRNEELVFNKKVRLEKDISDTDRFKRFLRYVYLPDGSFVNLQLVQEGYAYAATFPPDVKFADQFKEAMQKVREDKKGLWSECK